MAKKYARGHAAWGECGRCGARNLLNAMVFDGYYPNMRVCPACYEPKHPQENLKRIDDPVALWRPAPELIDVPAPVLTLYSYDQIDAILVWTAVEGGPSMIVKYLLLRDGVVYQELPIERDMFGGITSETLDYTDEDVLPAHTYQVLAVDANGNSGGSNIVTLVETFFRLLESAETLPPIRLLEDGGRRRLE